jgi:predicted component of type VI protein secretion system
MTMGRDPTLATYVLDSLSVEGLHARLRQEDDGRFLLQDEGSIAGTWVNYAPISREGVHLEHGDLVHIGKVAFRFEMSKPAHLRKPQVKAYKENP